MDGRKRVVASVLAATRQRLVASDGDTPDLDAQVLVAHVLGRDRAWLFSHPEYELSAGQADVLNGLVGRRQAGEPVAYLVGHREFFGLDFLVSPEVLIPRPDTEVLVERALELAARAGPLTICDVGCGSGAIAVSLAKHLPRARVLAVDISAAALDIARCNAARLGLADRVAFVAADLIACFAGPFHMIVANPPYLREDELPPGGGATAVGLAWEPRLALDGGVDGLATVRRLLPRCASTLAPGGALLMEIGAQQGPAVRALAQSWFPGAAVDVLPDCAGRDRVLRVVNPV